MQLKDFEQHIKGFPNGTKFNFGISHPFSWRGIYSEVAFEILEQPMTKEEILENINIAYTETFYGYKGGEYRYGSDTNIHFESDSGCYSDGGYVSRWIEKIEGKKGSQSQEGRFVNLAFS